MNTLTARRLAAMISVAGIRLAAPAYAQEKTVKIGVLNDMSSLYADIGGPNSVVAIKMAVEDSGLTKKGWKIELIIGDHQNKPDIGVNVARQWIDHDKVDVILERPNSASRSRSMTSSRTRTRSSSTLAPPPPISPAMPARRIRSPSPTTPTCSPTAPARRRQAGGDSWFFITADYAFGHALERDTSAVVTANGGKVLGGVGSDQHRRFLVVPAAGAGLQVQGHRACQCRRRHDQLDQAGGGIRHRRGRAKLAALLLFINDVHSLG